MRAIRSCLLALSLALTGCGSPQTQSSAPPPEGRSYQDYLRQGQKPEEREAIGVREQPADEAMVLHFIDVGQGSATLLEFPCGAILVDTGGEKNKLFDSEPVLLGYLDAFFERRSDLDRTLDALVISHPHIDHTRSIPAVLDNYRVRNIVDNGDVQDDIGGRPQLVLHEWLFRQNQRIHKRNRQRASSAPQIPAIGHADVSNQVGERGLTSDIIDPIGTCSRGRTDPKIRALWGMRLGRSEKGHNANDDSVVLRVDYGESSAFLSGDLELLAIARMTKHYAEHPELLDADIYYVPHHGSRNSTGRAWLAKIKPRMAVISMGPYERDLETWPSFTARSFGHPNEDSVAHLLDPTTGVTALRAEPIMAYIGSRGAWRDKPSEFQRRRIEKAIYATGWDGHVVVTAHADGRLDVSTRASRARLETQP